MSHWKDPYEGYPWYLWPVIAALGVVGFIPSLIARFIDRVKWLP